MHNTKSSTNILQDLFTRFYVTLFHDLNNYINNHVHLNPCSISFYVLLSEPPLAYLVNSYRHLHLIQILFYIVQIHLGTIQWQNSFDETYASGRLECITSLGCKQLAGIICSVVIDPSRPVVLLPLMKEDIDLFHVICCEFTITYFPNGTVLLCWCFQLYLYS